MIDVTGCKAEDLVRAAYDLSIPVGMGFLHAKPGSLTDEEVSQILEAAPRRMICSMDYIFGRACKFSIWIQGDRWVIRDAMV